MPRFTPGERATTSTPSVNTTENLFCALNSTSSSQVHFSPHFLFPPLPHPLFFTRIPQSITRYNMARTTRASAVRDKAPLQVASKLIAQWTLSMLTSISATPALQVPAPKRSRPAQKAPRSSRQQDEGKPALWSLMFVDTTDIVREQHQRALLRRPHRYQQSVVDKMMTMAKPMTRVGRSR